MGATSSRSAAVKISPSCPLGFVTPRTRAWARGLRTNATSRVPGSRMSPTNSPSPKRCRASSCRRMLSPMPPVAFVIASPAVVVG